MSFISYGVGWDSSACKFNVCETRSFWTQTMTNFGSYDTFQAAYSAAQYMYEELSKHQENVYLISDARCKQALCGSWGMTQEQRKEIGDSAMLPQDQAPAPSEQGRGDLPKSIPYEPMGDIPAVDLSRFSKEQQREIQRGLIRNLPVWVYANPSYPPSEMARYRNVLETSLYALRHPEAHVIVTDYGPCDARFGFKSQDNFTNYPDSVCYVPENWDFEMDGPGYTARDIIALCGGDLLKAEMVFSLCDWQHPETILSEWDKDDERALADRRSELSGPSAPNTAIPLRDRIKNVESRLTQIRNDSQGKSLQKQPEPARE